MPSFVWRASLRAQCVRPATAEERDRLWQQWVAVERKLDGYAGQRSTETAMIVLEPRDGTV